MPDANNHVVLPIGTLEYPVEQGGLAILQISAQRVRADIRDLHHARKLTVNKQRRLDDAVDAGPESAALVIPLHQVSVPPGDSRVVVVNQQTVCLVLRRADVLQEELESGYDLLKGLLIGGLLASHWVEVNLVDALGKQTGESPPRDAARNLDSQRPSFI